MAMKPGDFAFHYARPQEYIAGSVGLIKVKWFAAGFEVNSQSQNWINRQIRLLRTPLLRLLCPC